MVLSVLEGRSPKSGWHQGHQPPLQPHFPPLPTLLWQRWLLTNTDECFFPDCRVVLGNDSQLGTILLSASEWDHVTSSGLWNVRENHVWHFSAEAADTIISSSSLLTRCPLKPQNKSNWGPESPCGGKPPPCGGSPEHELLHWTSHSREINFVFRHRDLGLFVTVAQPSAPQYPLRSNILIPHQFSQFIKLFPLACSCNLCSP